MNSLIIRNGLVVHAEDGRVEKQDIAVEGGWIVKVAARILDHAVAYGEDRNSG